MAKAKAYKTTPRSKNQKSANANAKTLIKRRQHSQQKGSQDQRPSPRTNKTHQQQPAKARFGRHDDVLLVGEGDFSFALSLLENYKFASLTATCYDGEHELIQKYPNVKSTIEKLVGGSSKPVRPEEPSMSNGNIQPDEEGEWEGFSPSPRRQSSSSGSDAGGSAAGTSSQRRVLYGIDATKLSSIHRKRLRTLGPFSKIVFNFPHVGGLSKDVNRQVRANQQLLVGFFKAAIPLLSSPRNPARTARAGSYDDELSGEGDFTGTGQMIVTMFEGEPYTLWNIRDLARHSDLQVIESFRFPWRAYPGYQHARTIGDITFGKERAAEGQRKGAWRGEERDARCYILQVKEIGDSPSVGNNSRKRHRPNEGSDDDSD